MASPDVFREQPERERDHYKRALDEIAKGVPKEDGWDSAADFMQHVATVLDKYEVERPDHYEESCATETAVETARTGQ